MLVHPVRRVSLIHTRWPCLLVWLGVLGTLGCGSDTEPTPTGALTGTVTDAESGARVEAATITAGGHSTQTDGLGQYRLDGLPTGAQTLTAAHDGYATYSSSVTISPGGETVLDIPLLPGTGAPEAVTHVSAASGPDEGSVIIQWEPVPHALGYNLYWSTSPGVTPATGTKISPAGSPYLHKDLTPGTRYYYVVTASGDIAESASSVEVRAIARGTIDVQILSPTTTGLVDTPVAVEATITTALALNEVTVEVGGVSAPLTFDSARQRWAASVSLGTLASPATIVVRVLATDVDGNLGESSISARLDRHPTLTVHDPVNGRVFGTEAPIRVTCIDDSAAGCDQVTVVSGPTAIEGNLLFSGQGNVNSTFSVSSFAPGQEIFLEIRATDAAGQVTATPRYIFVETTPGLTEVANAGSGIIVDADADRLLVNNSGSDEINRAGGDTLRLVDRRSGLSTTILTTENTAVSEAKLTLEGALLIWARALGEFRNGTLSLIAEDVLAKELQVEGGWAVWKESRTAAGSSSILRRRDLSGSITQNLATGLSFFSPWPEVDLAPNGDVAYVKGREVFWFHQGMTQQLTSNVDAGLRAITVATDGGRVAQGVAPIVCCSGAIQLALLDPSGDISLASGDLPASILLNAGWAAFPRDDIGGVPQVWVRSPGGSETQLSFFGFGSATPTLLKSDGELVFNSQYRASPTSAAVRIAGGGAVPIYIGGVLHVMVGASLFRVN